MPRYLTCIDPVPASDGTCQQTAWIEQAGIADMLPTIEEATPVGFAFMASLVTLAAIVALTRPPKEGD